MKSLLCIITNGFEEVEYCGTYGIVSRGGVKIDTYSLHETSATGRYGLTISNLKNINELSSFDYDGLLIPGGPQYKELEKSELLKSIILKFNDEKKLIAAICAGPTILGKLGLLKGKNYTCFTSMDQDSFKGNKSKEGYVNTNVVTCKNIITARSASASIDFGFAILNYLIGKEKTNEIKKSIYCPIDFKYEVSAGAVLYKIKDREIQYLVQKMTLGHCSIPKGHLENNETLEEAAKREISEETSLTPEFDFNFKKRIMYSPYTGIMKEVYFFVAKCKDDANGIDKHDKEVIDERFHSYETAYDMLTYDNDKEILKEANEYIRKKEGF